MHHYKGLVKPYVLWSFLLIVLPLALILLYSITTGDNSLITIHFTLDNFRKISDPIYLNVFIKSLQMGLITTGVCLVLAYLILVQLLVVMMATREGLPSSSYISE